MGIKRASQDVSNVFGVVFQNKEIASLYIAQTNFKGIGILVDPSISKEEVENAKYTVSNCIYMERASKESSEKYVPVAYRDISLDTIVMSNEKYRNIILEIFLRAFFEAYIKMPKFGAYYISLFSNFIRSFGTGLKWDMKSKTFYSAPAIFDVITKMVTEQYESLHDLPDLDCLIFVLLDMVYASDSLSDHDKNSITKRYSNMKCITNKYLHCLNNLPKNIFQESPSGNNRDRFIHYCQEDFASDFVNSILAD